MTYSNVCRDTKFKSDKRPLSILPVKSRIADCTMGGGSSKSGGGSSASTKKASKSKSASKSLEPRGAYLTFSSDSGGILYLNWSETPVKGALAMFSPNKTVAGFKFTQNGGRLELMRNLGVTKKKYLEAWIAFFKEGIQYDADIKILDPHNCDAWVIDSGNKVKKVSKNDVVNAKSIYGMAMMPRNNESFKGVNNMDPSNFVNTATREGAGWKK